MTLGQDNATKTNKSIHRLMQLVGNDRRTTVRMIAHELNLNRKSMQTILFHDLRIKKGVCQTGTQDFVGRLAAAPSQFCKAVQKKISHDPDVFGQVITGYETSVFQNDL